MFARTEQSHVSGRIQGLHGPNFHPRRRGAARRHPRRRVSLPTASPTRGTVSWIWNSDSRPTSKEDGQTPHNSVTGGLSNKLVIN